MTEILTVAGLALLGSILSLFLLESKLPVLAVLLAVVLGAGIFIYFLPKLGQIFGVFQQLGESIGVNRLYLTTIFKIIGVTYIAEFAAQICRDAGQGSLAAKVEFAAKIIVIVLAIPIMFEVLNAILRLLQ